ncbi:MAG: VanW family protein [bacterium]
MFGLSKKEKIIKKAWLLIVIIFFVIIIALAGLYFFFEIKYKNEIYPNVYLGEYNLSGQTVEQARDLVKQSGGLFKDGIEFAYLDEVVVINPATHTADFEIDANKSIYEAFNYGRDANLITNLNNRIKVLLFGENILLAVSFNRDKLKEELKNNFNKFEDEMQEASIVLNNDGFDIKVGKEGQELDYDRAITLFEKNIKQVDDSQIKLNLITKKPTVSVKDIDSAIEQAKEIADLAPLKFIYKEFNQEVDKSLLVSWLELQNKDKEVIVGINNEKLKEYLEEIKTKIDHPAADAEFERVGNRITTWKPATNGLDLDLKKTIEKTIEEINNKNSEIELVVGEIRSLSKSSKEAEELGLIEVIGVGRSNFSGSPANRRHNIKVGATQLNGLLIKPDEEFSLLVALGEVDAESGYLPELVIKPNETVPEYGGGLCQIATTTFRAVLKTGLEITMRRNHSYRVGYYEPAGTDATIYDPWPDFRFKNDTGKHIMLRTWIDGDNLVFTFWGTNDGRKVEMSDPVIYNIVKPEETKIVETTELAVGEKKCIESAHNGADAYFNYKIIRPDGEVETKRYDSHYIPWREVCLIGVESLTPEEEEIGAGSDKWENLQTEETTGTEEVNRTESTEPIVDAEE